MNETASGYLDVDRAVDSIQVGARHRHDLGDIDALAESIRTLGLLQPITVTPDGVLVCGLRRLAAIKQLGMRTTRVWVRTGISTGVQHLLAEKDENTLHKPLSIVEAAAVYREIKTLLAEDAARRQAGTQFSTARQPGRITGPADGGGRLPPPSRDAAKSRTQAARLATGSAAYKRLEAVGRLERIRDDAQQRPQIRQHAAEALEKVEAGAPVLPLYELIKSEIATNVYGPARPTPDPDREVRAAGTATSDGGRPGLTKGTVRRFLLMVNSLDGWTDTFDADQIGRGLSAQEWATFERVLDALGKFAVVARAGRAAADAHRVQP
ncbi:ParB N-terminal domain-containing protein [Xylanimonas protaetiae]|uniref:Chromosome partitioning protein ParB n=1 Tax=Xylanimonas protaetiae TaxID=2509457 RepID=A0A4P6F041_9MICO|nr:ParB/RepB/Spo0J family partition protein [Xylanimonas protaetiae]QAY68774.1 chromosome partitioning protein ParB [Xylanimonas protaetiae]